ncbi:hypothetical protein BGW38_002583 [Lunasporangiospora selenospora]|uniref:Uncharacterized protein n=1 Tax=Lunasporangiospora selenospora TaxID=979761 RepID=A0A9P6KDG0_9FUNG|nr:hypothetical protein BGW38_002583 [Lunasporangiospora selenospora]
MKPSYSSTSVEATLEPYDGRYYNSTVLASSVASSSTSSSSRRAPSPPPSSSRSHAAYSPAPHTAYSNRHTDTYPHHGHYDDREYQDDYDHHQYSRPPSNYAFQQYSEAYHASALHVRHSAGYQGHVRNSTRDHNDHLVTDPSKDQQFHHDQYHRDPTYGYLKAPGSRSPPRDEDDDDELPPVKYSLPPILPPEEPFYRSDMPGRHMRYFTKVTGFDRGNSNGFYSSARHIAPSNTTGNFGDGPSIDATLERFTLTRQRQHQQEIEQRSRLEHEHRQHYEQQHQQPQQRLPSLYSVLPDQRPMSSPYPEQSPRLRTESSPGHHGYPTHLPPPPHHPSPPRHHDPSLTPLHRRRDRPHSPGPAPVESRHYANYPPHSPHQSHYKPKPIQPRSIAPAPTPVTVPSPTIHHQSLVESKKPSAHPYPPHPRIKDEPHDPRYRLDQHSHPHPQSHRDYDYESGKRKWTREHSPVREAPRPKAVMDTYEPMDDSSQELHLFSRRPAQAASSSRPLPSPPQPMAMVSRGQSGAKPSHPKMKMQRYQMTTIRCWHGAIAQKSYGIEKRYLCPPPMVQVSAGLNAKQIKSEQPHVVMSILHEKLNTHQGENLMEQDCQMDDHLRALFRNLHVTGTGADSSKRFKLGLQVYLNKNSKMPTAIMDSNPIPIISKPSKKTAKAGNASCFILNGMSVALLNRINAQTVRTKYMAVDNNAVCAKIGSWSSFTIKMVKPPPSPPVKIVPASVGVFRTATNSTKFVPIRMKGESSPTSASSPTQPGPIPGTSSEYAADIPGHQRPMPSYHPQYAPHHSSSQQQHAQAQQQQQRHQTQPQQEPTYVFSNSEPVLYGSEVVLINDLTGIMTDRLVIRKVENGKVVMNGTGPVSQMQKIVLQHPTRVHPEDGRPYYLSASSIGSPKVEGKIPLQAAMDRSPLLEYRTSSKKASIMDMTESPVEDDEEYYEDEEAFDGQPRGMPRVGRKNQGNISVDDFVCWTIAGIAKFEYTYFGPIPASIDTEVDPRKLPTILTRPRYNSQSNTIQMKVKNVFERLSNEEESRRMLLQQHHEDLYERKLSLSEFVYKRCEDVRQPMLDEEGPVQLWLAQHGPIRVRRRTLSELDRELQAIGGKGEERHLEGDEEDEAEVSSSEDEDEDVMDDKEEIKEESSNRSPVEDQLPKIPTKSNNAPSAQEKSRLQHQRFYGGSHMSSSATAPISDHQHHSHHQHHGSVAGGKKKKVKMVSKVLGLEAELPFGCEVRVVQDASTGHYARTELDILLVERSTGIAYRSGYKIAYSRDPESGEWTIEVVG